MKTNAARLLDSLGIPYELRDYEVEPEDLSAKTVAGKVGLPPEQVFKTLVARGDRTGVLLAVVPGGAELDLKALARVSGDRKVDVVPLREVAAAHRLRTRRRDGPRGQEGLPRLRGRDGRAV